MSRVGFWGSPSWVCVASFSLHLHLALLDVSVCPKLLFLQGHQSYWIRACSNIIPPLRLSFHIQPHSQMWGTGTSTYEFCCSVVQSCPTVCDLMDCSTPSSLSQSLLKLMSLESGMPSNHLILCHLLLLLPSISYSIRVFSNESALLIRCPKYRNFSLWILGKHNSADG